MVEPLDAFRYISYIRSHWHWITISGAASLLLAVSVSLVLPKEYTATARILIEPPAGADPRSAMAVSPVYLEALKTYEEFARSDSLFLDAVKKFQLRGRFGVKPIEALKQQVLKVSVVRNTRILEISVTLPDPRIAHDLAASLAESTVGLNQSAVLDSNRELTDNLEEQERSAKARVEAANRAWADLISREPVEDLKAAIEDDSDARAKVEEQAGNTELEISDNANRLTHATAAEADEIRKEQSGAAIRLKELQRQLETIAARNTSRARELGARMARQQQAEDEREAAQAASLAVQQRLREVRGESGYRGERLKIIDPGVVPERPSSPNIPLNAAAALLLGLLLPSVYLVLSVAYQDQRATGRRNAYRALRAQDV